jgi:hypothetical protein
VTTSGEAATALIAHGPLAGIGFNCILVSSGSLTGPVWSRGSAAYGRGAGALSDCSRRLLDSAGCRFPVSARRGHNTEHKAGIEVRQVKYLNNILVSGGDARRR